MSWDIEFDDEAGFVSGFDSGDSLFFSGNDSIQPSSFGEGFIEPEPEPEYIPSIPAQPLQQISVQNPSANFRGTQQPDSLAEENDQLRQFFTSLKEKAEQAESLNQSLKSQLENCRNWFKNAMFTGISNHK